MLLHGKLLKTPRKDKEGKGQKPPLLPLSLSKA